MINGFLRIGAYVPKILPANITNNVNEIKAKIALAHEQNVNVAVFPCLALSGVNVGELFCQRDLKEKIFAAANDICIFTKTTPNTLVIFGCPIYENSKAYVGGYAMKNGEIIGKFYQNNIKDEHKKWFTPRENGNLLLKHGNSLLNICCDKDVTTLSAKQGNIIINPCANYATASSYDNFTVFAKNFTKQNNCVLVSVSPSYGESTSDNVYAGDRFIYQNGKLLCEGERFAITSDEIIHDVDTFLLCEKYSENAINVEFENIGQNEYTFIEKNPFLPSNQREADKKMCEILAIQTMGLAKRMEHIRAKGVILGISGGLDSTLALLVAIESAKKLGMENSAIWGITMPGYGTGDRTYNNALSLMKALDITSKEISIKAACESHFKDIEHSVTNDITFENAQARERTQILLDMSNKHGLLMLGTGDLSENALGFCTYGGDQFSMYNVNASVAKTLMQHMVRFYANNFAGEEVKAILLDIVDTPISPELFMNEDKDAIAQKTENIIGPYELHDFFLYYYVKYHLTFDEILQRASFAFKDNYTPETINNWLTKFFGRFFASQFKRSATADSPKIGSISLSGNNYILPSDLSVN